MYVGCPQLKYFIILTVSSTHALISASQSPQRQHQIYFFTVMVVDILLMPDYISWFYSTPSSSKSSKYGVLARDSTVNVRDVFNRTSSDHVVYAIRIQPICGSTSVWPAECNFTVTRRRTFCWISSRHERLYGGGVVTLFSAVCSNERLYGGGVVTLFSAVCSNERLYGGGVVTLFSAVCSRISHVFWLWYQASWL